MAIRITIEDGENKVIRTIAEDSIPWPKLFDLFFDCLRGLGYTINEKREQAIIEAVVGYND